MLPCVSATIICESQRWLIDEEMHGRREGQAERTTLCCSAGIRCGGAGLGRAGGHSGAVTGSSHQRKGVEPMPSAVVSTLVDVM